MKRNFLLPVFLLGFFTVPARAQGDISPGVARISLILGDVSTRRGDTGEWAAASVNLPLVGGDWIWTGDRSQAEVQLDHGNILRLGNNAQVKIATVERTRIQVQVGQGLAYYTIPEDSEAEVEIDTPNAAIRPEPKEGVYRIEVDGFETQVIARKGAANISTPQGGNRVARGQASTVRGTADEAGCVLGGAPAQDRWDSWNNDRDGAIRNAQSWKHTNLHYTGSEDLDGHGRWVSVPEYGQVWSPRVGVKWAPYRAGGWVWEPYWGWTWVSQEPWGWAPYHYGRWFLHGSSWMWWPGPANGRDHYRPEWAPAYVSFFGFGFGSGLGEHRGSSAGFGFGSVGWLPLGPGDYFYPWYGRDSSRFNKVSVTDATGLANSNHGFDGVAPLQSGNRFSNLRLTVSDARIRKAVSTLPADDFGTGHREPTTVSREAFDDGWMMTGNLPIVPTGETLSAANRPASPMPIVRGRQQERFFTKKQPATPPPQSVDKQAAVRESIQEKGPLVPVREVTPLDTSGTARPQPSEHGIERATQPTKNAKGGRISRARLGKGLRATSSPGIPRAKLRSTRRMATLAPVSRRATAGAAQSYVDSAQRQMDKGNYRAAIASYKRAWQVDGNSAAARARMGRARRAMRAENEIIADRR